MSQHFWRVVRRRLFPFPPRKAIDKLALRMHAKRVRRVRAGTDALVLVILIQLAFGHEVTNIQIVHGVAAPLDFVKIFLREEPPVGQQRFIHTAKLVDAQIAVADTAPTFASLAFCVAHLIDDIQQNAVSDPRFFDQLRTHRIKDMCLERINAKHALNRCVVL